MKAVVFTTPGSIDREGALVDVELPAPVPGEHDVLVEISAVSGNPVDCEIREAEAPADGEVRVLGWDAVDRQDTNAQIHLVDARIAAKAPTALSDAEAAALPLTSLTAWEMLFDRLDVNRPVPGAAPAVVIIGAAGGVGSMAIQLLRARTDLAVIATASRPETKQWCQSLGCAPRPRPQLAARPADRRARHRGSRNRALDRRIGRPPRRHHRAARPAGPLRIHR